MKKETENERTRNNDSKSATGNISLPGIDTGDGNIARQGFGTSTDVGNESSGVYGANGDVADGPVGNTEPVDTVAGSTGRDSGRSGGNSDGSISGKRGRGRPRGSKSRNRSVDTRGRGRNSGGRTRIESSEENNQENIPGSVNFENILPFPEKKKATRTSAASTALSKFLSTAYRVPMHAGYGDHWPLTKEESDDFANAILDLQAALPKNQQVWLSQVLKQYLPLVAFAGIAYAINVPRVLATREVMRESRTVAKPEQNPATVQPEFRTSPEYNPGVVQADFARNDGASTAKSEFAKALGRNLAPTHKVTL